MSPLRCRQGFLYHRGGVHVSVHNIGISLGTHISKCVGSFKSHDRMSRD